MKLLKRLFRKYWDRYPKGPFVYVCSHNGVVGAVRAEDYDDEVRRMRKEFQKKRFLRHPVRPQVYPVFLFSNKNVGERSFRVGTENKLNEILMDCVVEFRDFELPPLNAPGSTPFGYEGMFEQVGRENTRHRVWSDEQANTYLRGGKISTYNL